MRQGRRRRRARERGHTRRLRPRRRRGHRKGGPTWGGRQPRRPLPRRRSRRRKATGMAAARVGAQSVGRRYPGGAAIGGRRLGTSSRGGCGGVGRACTAIAPLPGVLLHRLVDEVVDAAFQLVRHLLERLPEDVSALERSGALLVGVRAHRLSPFVPSREPGHLTLRPSSLAPKVPSVLKYRRSDSLPSAPHVSLL